MKKVKEKRAEKQNNHTIRGCVKAPITVYDIIMDVSLRRKRKKKGD